MEKNPDKLNIPKTPYLKKIGYGTGVGVFHVSPQGGNFNSPWALKKLMCGNMRNQKVMAERLRNEAKVLEKLSHPNIVGFRAFLHTDDGRECLAMEECLSSLGDLIEKKQMDGPFSVKIISKVAVDIANALNYIHNDARILHGDIKSHNILIKGDFDIVKLCDFGVSLPLDANGKVAEKNAYYIGTRLWSAPEVLEEKNEVIITDKADIFSYGLTIWEMMSMTPPYSIEFDESECTEESFDEDAYEAAMNEMIGTCPDIPSDILLLPEYKNVIELFHKCCETDYKSRISAAEVVKFCKENIIS